MIEGRHGGSGAACGPRPKLPHFIYFTQTDWLWVRPRLSLHYSTPPPITQYTSHTTKSSLLTVRQNVEFFCFTCGCTYTVQYQVNTMAVSWPPETIQRRFFFCQTLDKKPIYHTEKSHLRPVGSRSDAPRKSPLGNTIVLLPAWFFQPIIIIFT